MHNLCPCRDPSLPGVFTSIVFQHISSAAPKVILRSEDHQLLKPYVLHSLKLSNPSWFDPCHFPRCPFSVLLQPCLSPFPRASLLPSHSDGLDTFSKSFGLFRHVSPWRIILPLSPSPGPCLLVSGLPPPKTTMLWVPQASRVSLFCGTLRIKPDFMAWCLVST